MHYRVHVTSSMGSVSQKNPVQRPPNACFNIILTLTPSSFKWFLVFRFHQSNILHTSRHSHSCYIPLPVSFFLSWSYLWHFMNNADYEAHHYVLFSITSEPSRPAHIPPLLWEIASQNKQKKSIVLYLLSLTFLDIRRLVSHSKKRNSYECRQPGGTQNKVCDSLLSLLHLPVFRKEHKAQEAETASSLGDFVG